MTFYNCGFLFSEDLTKVVLIKKNRGLDDMIGKLNGIGGECNPNANPKAEMSLNFHEETGVVLSAGVWDNFFNTITKDGKYSIRFFTGVSSKITEVKSVTDEEVFVYSVNEFGVINEVLKDPLYPDLNFHLVSAFNVLKNKKARQEIFNKNLAAKMNNE